MLLEQTWNQVQAVYLDENYLDGKLALINVHILRSPQIRERHARMVEDNIYTPAYVEWLDEKLKQSPMY